MEEGIIWVLIVVAVLLVGVVLLQSVITLVIPAIYFALAILAHVIYGILDQLFSTTLFPRLPWLMWLIWGALIGAALGFWTLAPIFGWRNYRRWIIAGPFLLMALLQSICLLFKGIN